MTQAGTSGRFVPDRSVRCARKQQEASLPAHTGDTQRLTAGESESCGTESAGGKGIIQPFARVPGCLNYDSEPVGTERETPGRSRKPTLQAFLTNPAVESHAGPECNCVGCRVDPGMEEGQRFETILFRKGRQFRQAQGYAD